MNKVYVITFHGECQYDDGAFLSEQDALDYMKEKGYTSMWCGPVELKVN